ncbi:MAG: hypothetical protein HKN39_04685 [Flavobacteriales bacterium]|nr:hypothetical protein [Flavobacteriales bacterium]
MVFLDKHIGKIVVLVLLILFLIAWFGPFTVKYELNYTGKVYSAKKWSIKQENDQYITENRNFTDGISTSQQNYIFERGDIVELEFSEGIKNNAYVKKDTPLLEFRSYLLEQQLADLKSQVNLQLATTRAEQTGRKVSIVLEAEKNLKLMQQQLDLAEKNFARSEQLYQGEIIPAAEFQVVENELALAKTNVELAKQRIVSVTTGRKVESIGEINAQMNVIETQLNILNEKKRNYNVSAPFEGEVIMDAFSNDLISIVDTSAQVVIVPIEVEERSFINAKSSRACLELEGCDDDFDIVVHLDKKVNLVDNRQVILAKVNVPERHKRLDEGLLVNCRIMCDTISIREYIKRKFF